MTLALDIETLGRDPLDLDDDTRALIVKGCRTQEEAIEALRATALSPFTGEVIVVAMHDTEKRRSLVVAVTDQEMPADTERVSYRRALSEEMLLIRVWDVLRRQRQVVTFNGRTFDLPFLTIRAAVHGVPVVDRFAHANRYREDHLDLADWLQNYGASRFRVSLDLLCKTLGVPTPKDGIAGALVGDAWRAGRHLEVIDYCLRDTLALVECAARVGAIVIPEAEADKEAA